MGETYAPGAPGNLAHWTYSSKSGIGKALNAASGVVFTLGEGIVNEVYYPREDIACMKDMGFLVSDGKDFFSEEKKDTGHEVQMMHDGIPAYRIVNTCASKKYRITKEIIADPFRNTVLQKINFEPAEKDTLHLFALAAPHLCNHGGDNSGWTAEYKGVPMLFAQSEGLTFALASTVPWLKRSAGFVGVSDGWTDIHQHKEMRWEYTQAEHGNISLTGEIDLSGAGDFVLALSFGRTTSEAANYALGSLLDGFKSAKTWYMREWEQWLQGLLDIKGKYVKLSSMVLRMNEAKTFPGGIIASLSIPWGQTKGDKDTGGYHLVWPRDLVESAGGFMALQSKEDAVRILNYLMSTQNTDGSWPQNMWLSGDPHWKGIQMDQMALPLLLMDKCNRFNAIDEARMSRYWPGIKKAICYLVVRGPYTEQDRWEEEKGLSTFTLAAEIAGLLAGADLAEANGEHELAAYCRETADSWNDEIERWTYVTGTSLAQKTGVSGYYIRINPFREVAAAALGDRRIDLKNHLHGEGSILLSELVSADALALVRFGLREASDPKILDTIKVIDATLKVDTPGGPCWHRYLNDGYGEDSNGNPYSGTGIGRAWPLLTGERGHYEIAAGNMEGARNLLKAMESFTNQGLLPEQVWDTDDIPAKNLFSGKPSGSAMPLTWAHAEYLKLCASIQNEEVFDMPPQTQERYLTRKTVSPFQTWRFDNQRKTVAAGKKLRIEVMAPAVISWTDDDWGSKNDLRTKDTGIGLFIADLPVENNGSGHIRFTFLWTAANRWEEKNFDVEIEEK